MLQTVEVLQGQKIFTTTVLCHFPFVVSLGLIIWKFTVGSSDQESGVSRENLESRHVDTNTCAPI